MRRNPMQFVCLNLLAAAPTLCGAAAVRPHFDRQTVLVYNDARVKPDVLATAQQQAARIFRAAEIDLLWMNCPIALEAPSGDSECDGRLKRDPVVVRVTASAGSFPSERGLGYAAVDSGGGIYVFVFLDRVRRFHSRTGARCDLGWLLGHVIAHEMGHLLLSLVGHMPNGIMMAHWGAKEMRKIADRELLFSVSEAQTMRQAVSRRAAVAAASGSR